MKIAVIGAGFAGLAAAYYISEYAKVFVYEKQAIGAGASGVSAGLLHPYPGRYHRRSLHSFEALHDAKELIHLAENKVGYPVADRKGIQIIADVNLQGEDIVSLKDRTFLVRSGLTVFSQLYLEGLWKICQERGVQIYFDRISTLDQLKEFDKVILALGAGIQQFVQSESLNIQFLKGQVLQCKTTTPLTSTVFPKGYKATTSDPYIYCHGSTYEKKFTDESPCLEIAQTYLNPTDEVIRCRAGIRVMNRAHYFPILKTLNEKTWIITALGSRGLLYHAYLAKQIRNLIFNLK